MGIGGILLCILAGILLVLCLVLLAPVSYTLKGKTPEKGPEQKPEFSADLAVYGIPVPYRRFLNKEKKEKKENAGTPRRKKERAKFSLRNFYASINNAKRFLSYYLELLKSEHGQGAINSLKETAGKVIPKLLPKKWYVRGNVGFGDPYLTGKLAEGLVYLSPFTGKSLQVNPVFEEPEMNLKAYAKGRIRVYTLLFAGWKLYRDPYIRMCLEKLKKAPSPHGAVRYPQARQARCATSAEEGR